MKLQIKIFDDNDKQYYERLIDVKVGGELHFGDAYKIPVPDHAWQMHSELVDELLNKQELKNEKHVEYELLVSLLADPKYRFNN